MLPTDYHTLVCTNCGTEHPGYLTTCENNGAYQSVLVPTQTYTRLKRFRKYLARAGKSQCASSVPKETWEYLLANGPYSCPGAIVRALKKAGKNRSPSSLPGFQTLTPPPRRTQYGAALRGA